MLDKAVELKFTCSATAQKVLGSNPSRTYAVLVNDGTDPIYLGMGAPATVNRGIRLNANGGTYEITSINPWHGEIYAVGSALNPTLHVVEW